MYAHSRKVTEAPGTAAPAGLGYNKREVKRVRAPDPSADDSALSAAQLLARKAALDAERYASAGTPSALDLYQQSKVTAAIKARPIR